MHLKERINCMEEAVNTLNGLLIELQFHLCLVSIILYLPKFQYFEYILLPYIYEQI